MTAPKRKVRNDITRGRAKRVLKVGELATSVGSSYLWQALRAPFRSADKRQQALLDTHIKNAIKVAARAVETGMNDQIGDRLEAAAPVINAAAEMA